MKRLILLIFLLAGVAGASCRAGYDPILLGGILSCPPGTGGAVGGQYAAPVSGATGLTVTAATHGLGTVVTGVCYDNATPRNTIVQTAGFPTVAANGDIVFAWTGSKTGTCYVYVPGQGAVGATGSTGATGATGAAGSTGATGPGYYATSTTSLLIGTGSKAFTTQAGLAYVAGARAKAVSAADAANFMHGLVTSYSGTTLTVLVDTTGGSGTLADWNLTVQGDTGTTGATGAQGPPGSVSVVASGTLTSGACVTGGGSQLVQTPTGCTIDSDGDLVAKSVSSSDTSVAGEVRMYELNDTQTNFLSWAAPDTVTANLKFTLPNASPAALDELVWTAPSSNATTGTFRSTVRTIGAVFNGGGSALTSGTTVGSSLVYSPPLAIGGVVIAWTVTVDAGTCGFRVWRKAAGTAIPTVSDTLNGGDLAIASNTNLRSTTMTNFTGGTAPTLAANDILAFQLNAAATATYCAVSLQY